MLAVVWHYWIGVVLFDRRRIPATIGLIVAGT